MLERTHHRRRFPWAGLFLGLGLWLGRSGPGAAYSGEGGGGGGVPEHKVYLDAWSYARLRKTINSSNKVIARFTLKNITEKVLDDVAVTLTLRTPMGEPVSRPLRKRLGRVKPKETRQVQLSALLIPIFGSYRILVTYRGGKETWGSASDVGKPMLEPDKPLEGAASVVVLGQDLAPDRAGYLRGKLRVKNQGTLKAKNVKVHITFYGTPSRQRRPPRRVKGKKPSGPSARHGRKLGEWSAKLGRGTLKGGEEKVLSLVVPIRLPRGYAGHVLRVSCDGIAPETAMSGGEFQNVKDLESAHFQFKRGGKKKQDLEVACQLRNGLSEPVNGVKLGLIFSATVDGKKKTVKTFSKTLSKTIPPGQIVPVAFTIKEMPRFEAFEQTLAFNPAGGKPLQARKPKALKFRNKHTVEVLFKEFMERDDGTVLVVCAARNGRPHHVKEIVVTARFLKADGSELAVVEKKLPDPLAPGGVSNFVLHAKHAKGYAQCTSEVRFVEMRPKPKRKVAAAAAAPKPAPRTAEKKETPAAPAAAPGSAAP